MGAHFKARVFLDKMELDGFRWELCIGTRTPLLVKIADGQTTPPRRTVRQLDCSPFTQPELPSSLPTERLRRVRALGLLSTLEGLAATNDSTSVLATLTPGEITRTTAALRVLLDTCQTIDTSETTTEQSQSPCPLALPDWLIVAEKLLRVQGEAAASA